MTDIEVDPATWEAAVGTPYSLTPGISALDNLRAISRNKQPIWELLTGKESYWEPPGNIQDLRRPAKGRPKDPIHRWDMRAAYLAAAAQIQLPYRRLEPDPYFEENADVVGYYRARGGIYAGWTAPKADRQGCYWTTHVTLRWLHDNDIWPEIVEGWVTDNSGRILRSWAERWRDIIAECGPQSDRLRDALKLGYAQAIGLMGAKTRHGCYRPDWRHMIIDQVRISMIRRIDRVQQLLDLWPARIDVDSVWYATTRPDQVGEALGVGDQIGRMRYEGRQE